MMLQAISLLILMHSRMLPIASGIAGAFGGGGIGKGLGSALGNIPRLKPKPGSAGGPGVGKGFPESVKDQARAETQDRCVFCGVQTIRSPRPHPVDQILITPYQGLEEATIRQIMLKILVKVVILIKVRRRLTSF